MLQLALDNALAPFFENNFGFGITKAANLAAIFGMMNFFSRPLSGLFSDLIARRYGMRGRLWWLWFVVAGGGASLSWLPNWPESRHNALVFRYQIAPSQSICSQILEVSVCQLPF